MNIEKIMEKRRKDRLIICPYCGYEHDISQHWEVMGSVVTYHGEEEPQEFTCQNCDEDFFVQEHVERTFEAKKTMKEFDL